MKDFLSTLLFALCMTGCAPMTSGASGTGSHVDATKRQPAQISQESTQIIELADHHAHIWTPAVSKLLENELHLPPLPSITTQELLPILEKDGVKKVAILSNAYMFLKPGIAKPVNLQAAMAEND